jgi:hypothetical protein
VIVNANHGIATESVLVVHADEKLTAFVELESVIRFARTEPTPRFAGVN